MISRIIFATLLLTVGCLLASCGSGNNTVAVVGDYEITVDEFVEYTGNLPFVFATAQEEFDKKREILDTLVQMRLLIQAAYDKHIDQVEELSHVILGNKDKFLLDALYQREIASKAVPTESEIKDYYNHLEFRMRASHILIADPDTADAVLARITAGENFEQLAFDYSIDPSAKRNRGDLGYFVWGAMVTEFQEAAFAMEVGEVSPPVKTQFGYHIIKLVDKAVNDQRPDFEASYEQIKSQTANQKLTGKMADYMGVVKDRYKIKIDTSICDYLLHKRESIYPPQLLATLPKNDFDMEQLDRSEKEFVLATWDGGQMTVAEYLEAIKQVAPQMKPDLDAYDSMGEFIFQVKTKDILVIEAYRQGMDNDPDYMRKMRMFKELNMADLMRNDSIPKSSSVTEGMARAYYDKNPDEFTAPAKILVYEILLSDEVMARKLTTEIKSLEFFKSKAMDLTERFNRQGGTYKEVSGELGFIERKEFPEIFDLARKTSIGEIGGPVVTLGKYSIFYVADKMEPALKDYLGVKRGIVQQLTFEQESSDFAVWAKQAASNTKIEIYDDVLWSTVDMSKFSSVDSSGSGS